MHVLMQEGEGRGNVSYPPSPLVPNLISSLLFQLLTYSRKIWRALNLVKWLYFEIGKKFNLAICTCNCTYDLSFWHYDVIVALLVRVRRRLARQTCVIENGDFWGRKVYSRLPCFQKYLEPNHERRIELCVKKDKHRGSLCCSCDT